MTRVEVLVIGPGADEDLVLHSVEQGDAYALRELVGGWLEAIYGAGWVAFCDEDGKHKRLPPNPAAGRLARQLGWRAAMPGDLLVGPVVFTGPADRNGDETSVPELVLRRLDPAKLRRQEVIRDEQPGA